MDGLCKTLHVASRDTSNGYSAVFGGIDRVLLTVSMLMGMKVLGLNVPLELADPFARASTQYMRTCQSRQISFGATGYVSK